ncbi:hypothetical protein PFISCL1PPCAC_19832 [Pristionchus fissidentatus]|uniref:Bridge-like lipid transfer protein family member 1 C-terminal domain-containing protein n=1 Tax=Pristionchus fissidentatus TaxID=1538716 RepID=A0AAV5W9Z6_9BILA|nr:hypothetical protein PFISCL1PPCAC_19832 [Pristionchus fissidentatus]
MSGMIIDVDQRVGQLAKLLISAFSQIGEMGDDIFALRNSSLSSVVSIVSSSEEEDVLSQMKKLDPLQDREKWLERKIRDQTDLVVAFLDCNASTQKVEEERKVLRRMENARLKYFMAKIRSGDNDDKGRTRTDKDSRTVTSNPLEKVNMNIQAELKIASGKCSLRTPTLTSRPSTKDLGSRIMGRQTQTNSTVTTIIIPSVSSDGVYHSGREKERGSLHLSISLQSIPAPQILTPHIADFVEMMLEPLPSSWSRSEEGQSLNGFSSPSLSTPNDSSRIDTNSLPFDFVIVVVVDASEIKFVGQQPRSSAADCRLQLPSLSLAASSRVLSDKRASLDVSASLSKFSLSVYSPHQTTNHDALSLSLDHLAFVVSRSKNAGVEKENRVEMVATASIGNALIAYDGRRISELVSFPKPWYRAAVVRRLFFGDKYMQPREVNKGKYFDNREEKRWRTKIVVGVRWKELDVKVQMGNTMGSTVWNVSNGECRIRLEMSSEREMSGDGMLALDVCRLSAVGGAIGGDISLKKLMIKCRHTNSPKEAPTNRIRIEVKEIVARLEWMSRIIVLAEATLPSISFCDLWDSKKVDNQVKEAVMSINGSLNWKTLQLVITNSTVGDIDKCFYKISSFFKDQLRSSKIMWETAIAETSREFGKEGRGQKEQEEEQHGVGIGYWQSLLDQMINIQHGGLLPFPVGDGSTYLRAGVHVCGDAFSMVLMNGEMGSTSWALFHFHHPSLLYSTHCCLKFRGQGDEKELVRHVMQRAIIALGKSGEKSDKQAVVMRVQSKGVGMSSSNTTREMLDSLIADALKGGKGSEKSSLDLFQFPSLEAVYQSDQEEETVVYEDDEEEKPREVPTH